MLCEGSAFQRVMRVDAAKFKDNSLDEVKAVVTALGGIWGKTNVRTSRIHYCAARGQTHESHLARHGHQFESLLSAGVSLEQLRAYVLLRNSGLAAEDNSNMDSAGQLEYDEVVKSLKLRGRKFFSRSTCWDEESNQKSNL